ncbi:hypothetical protein TNCV_4615891 [Trichonephila clavipes]|nr:hypothetical protein TNCV_4615891 [Trichonephila clavipes]
MGTERDPCPNQDSTTSITVSFNSVGLMVSSALFPPDQRPESLSIRRFFFLMKWSATSCGTVVVLLLRELENGAGVVARGRPGTMKQLVSIPKSLNNTTRHIETSSSISLRQSHFHPSNCPPP